MAPLAGLPVRPGTAGPKFPQRVAYNAYLVVVLVCAAVDGAARLDRALLAAAMRAVPVVPVPRFAFAPAFAQPSTSGMRL